MQGKAPGRTILASDEQALASAASSVKLWEPQTPADVASGFSGANALLVGSLKHWQDLLADGKPVDKQTVSLVEEGLSKSSLTPQECVQMTRLLAGWEDCRSDETIAYHRLTAAFARQAVWSASAEIHQRPDEIQKFQAIVAPLIRRLWWGLEPEMDGPQLDLHAVKEFYTLLWQFSPDGSPDKHRGQEGRIEAMIFCQEFKTAEADARVALDESQNLSQEERADFAYLEGWSLYYLHRYSEAESQLCIAVDRPNCEKSERAFRLLALSRAHLRDKVGTARAIRFWVARFHPDCKEAMPLFSLIDSFGTGPSTQPIEKEGV